MPAFHQIGHDSENLLFEEELSRFGGAILSPLNYTPAEVISQLERLRDRANFVTVFDPHLYRPQSERGCLPRWDYYPADVDTADFSDEWWAPIVDSVAATAVRLGTSAVASPAVVPRSFTDEYFLQLLANGARLATALRGTTVRPIQTMVVNLPEIASVNRAMMVASVFSRSAIEDLMLVVLSPLEPRRELADPEELKGVMRLIATLETGGQRVTVATSGPEMLLWKLAGASNCATGKFFNLRRFTVSRFAEPEGAGGGQLPYWFEEGLLAFLRQSDVLRVRDRGLFSPASMANPFAARILEAITAGQPWVRWGWRKYLYWFADAEFRIANSGQSPIDIISTADDNWTNIERGSPRLYMEDRQNDGAWVRQWLRAAVEFPYFV